MHRYDITVKGGITIWEGPIASLMFVQFLKDNVLPLNVSYCQSFCGGSSMYSCDAPAFANTNQYPDWNPDWNPGETFGLFMLGPT